jgi:predicted nucleic acid-binding protein
MSGYADAALLCSLYAPDAHTARAIACRGKQSQPLPVVWIHPLEVRNALRLRVFRREITGAQRDTSLNASLADLASGVLVIVSPPLTEGLTEAERLSALHSDTLGTRSLDILHVAAAVVLGSREFLTFDRRQANLARAAGLIVPVV